MTSKTTNKFSPEVRGRAVRMLEYGVFLRDLNKHCDGIGIDRTQHILLKTSQFLMFGGDLARTISGAESVTP